MIQIFGAYLQCYKNPYATYKCLESFRQFYPDRTIVLLSDNGYNYSEMAKFFNCIYIHEYENILVPYTNLDDGSHIIKGHDLIERIIKVFNLFKEEYIIWLEDDVSINNIINDNLKYDLNGFSPNKIPIEELQKKYTFLNNGNDYRYSGHGGSIYHKQHFLDYVKNKEIINDILINWKEYKFPINICHDLFFSIIITLNKGTVGLYAGHYDFASYKNDTIIVQHQYKCWYGHQMPENIKYLIEY